MVNEILVLMTFLNEFERSCFMALIATICHHALFYYAFGIHVDNKFCALARLTLYVNAAAHQLNKLLADGKAQASALPVSLRILIKLVEVDEKF